jgi:hypothetical protein
LLSRFTQAMPTRRFTFVDADVARVLLWAALHDRPINWACDGAHWPAELRPERLPTPSTMSRRLRRLTFVAFLTKLHRALRRCFRRQMLHMVDGHALPVRRHTTDPDALRGWGQGCYQWGYKLHVLCDINGHIRSWRTCAMNADERTVARALVPDAQIRGYLLADAAYDANPLHAVCRTHGVQLVAPRRLPDAGLGTRKHDPGRLRAIEMMEQSSTGFGPTLYAERLWIERLFGTMVSAPYGLGHLPAWVRRQHRVEVWVAAKIIILTVAQRRRRRAS